MSARSRPRPASLGASLHDPVGHQLERPPPGRGRAVDRKQGLRLGHPFEGQRPRVIQGAGGLDAIADRLGGHCIALRRTKIGPFGVHEADPDRIIPPDEALARLP